MSKLPPFDPDAKCPKCGHDDVGCLHRRKHEMSGLDDMDYDRERINRFCTRCGYHWNQAPLDGPHVEPPTR